MKELLQKWLSQFTLPLHNPVLIFSLVLFIILLAPILLKRLNIPGIIGLIISGVIIGPHGLNLLEKSSAIVLFSTIGLLYIMFIAGLELDLHEFKNYRYRSLLFGFFTFIIPIITGFPVCYYLLQYDLNASFLTASMFATHTLVAYPIVSKLGITKNQAVAITVGGTILTDTAVLIILAVIMGNRQGELNQAFWLRLVVSLLVFLAIMFLVVPRVAAWFFRKLESERHAHYIFVLSVVFFAAFLAELAGVEPIIGAFIAGLALNPLIPYNSPLMNRIEFIGNSLFIPFFLITVGMLVDVRVLLKGPEALLVAAILTIVALLGKWLAALITQQVFRYSAAQRSVIFGLSSSHAAATLAVILVGFQAGILDENILNGTIILILITCVVASFVTERAAKKMVLAEEQNMPGSLMLDQAMNEHILVPLEDASRPEYLLDFAVKIKSVDAPHPITLLQVVPGDEEIEVLDEDERSTIDSLIRQGSELETPVNYMTTVDHNAASGISRTSREILADIVVMDWPDRRAGIIDMIFGEKADQILSICEVNLFVCRIIRPFSDKKRLVVLCPPLFEKEAGFALIVKKTSQLATVAGIPIAVYSTLESRNAFQQMLEKMRLPAKVSFREFSDWEDFLVLSRDIQSTDFILLYSSTRGAISYMSVLEKIPQKLEKYFAGNNMVIAYPPKPAEESGSELYEDFNATGLKKGIEAIEQIGKEIKSIFKK